MFEVRSSPVEGRGLFARGYVSAGGVIGVFHLLMLPADELQALRATRVYHYVFDTGEDADGWQTCGLALGEISFCNHSAAANARFVVDAEARTVTLSAARAIAAGDEIFIDYEEFADEIL